LVAEKSATRDLREIERARRTVDHRHAVQQQARGQRAEHEVLHRRFRRHDRIAVKCDQRIGTQRQQFEAEVHRDEAASRNEQHHAERREQQQQVELADEQLAFAHVAAAVDEDECGRQQHEQFQDRRHAVAHEHAVERGYGLRRCTAPDKERGRGERNERQGLRHVALRRLEEQVDEQDRAGRAEQEDLGRERGEVGGIESHHVRAHALARSAVARRSVRPQAA
jgi:hypothetical protein